MPKTPEITEIKLSKADILSNFKVPIRKGKGRMDKSISINIGTSHLILTKAMAFSLGYPKQMAFSFADDKIFIIPNPTLEGIVPFEVRKTSTVAQINTIINNKDLITDIGLTVGVFEGKFELASEFYMEINGNKVYQLKVKPPTEAKTS